MDNTNIKNIKLVSELMSFCYNYGAKKVNIEIEHLDNMIQINVSAYIKNIDASTLNEVKNRLSSPRCHEIEEYYWSLSGDDNTDSELILVGMMIDKASVTYDTKNHLLNMSCIREV